MNVFDVQLFNGTSENTVDVHGYEESKTATLIHVVIAELIDYSLNISAAILMFPVI